MCKFEAEQPFTSKWLDEENDLVQLALKLNSDQAIRLFAT